MRGYGATGRKGNVVIGGFVNSASAVVLFAVAILSTDSKYKRVDEKSKPTLYFPFAQHTPIPNLQVELRTSGNPEALIPSVHAILYGLDRNLLLQKPITQRAQFDESYSQARLFARLSIFFAAIAVLLVATGLYGTRQRKSSRCKRLAASMRTKRCKRHKRNCQWSGFPRTLCRFRFLMI